MKLTREERLACIIALERERKLGGWSKSALVKLLKSMGMKPQGKGVGSDIEL